MGAIQSWYDHHVLPRWVGAACGMPHITALRTRVVPAAQGVVLEVGIGPGYNLGLYDPCQVTRVIGADPVSAMTDRAAHAVAHSPVPVEMLDASAEDLPLENGQADTAVLTFTACTIPRVEEGLAELRRVIKPGGRLLFLEHGLSPDPQVARWQRRMDPWWGRLAGGCHVSRDIAVLLRDAGFEILKIETEYAVKTPRVLGYLSWGAAAPH